MNSKTKQSPTLKDQAIIKNYVIQNKNKLISNLYMNILVGYNRFPKPYGFFKKLSGFLKKSTTQTKLMFLHMEQELLINILGIPKAHYDLHMQIKQINSSQGSDEVTAIKDPKYR
jgi:hypothetical protein